MIAIVAKMTVRPDQSEAFKSLAEELLEATRKEPGCQEYALYEDLKDPRILTFIEKYRDMDAVKAHNASAHFTRIVAQLGPLTEGPAEVNLYQPTL